MGNCCRRESATVDDLDEEPRVPRKHPPMEKESKAAEAPAPLRDQLKIKITKKELEKLMANARLQEVPLDRVLSQLIADVNVDLSHVQRRPSWAPSLHSIAE